MIDRGRLTRRRVVGLGLSAGLTTLVVACAGAPSAPAAGTAAPAQSKSAPATPAGPTQIKKGGTFAIAAAGNPPSLDPYASSSEASALFASYCYSRLFMLKSGPGVQKGSLDTVGDAAEFAQVSTDGLTYTIKLRPNVRFHPPLDRLMTAEDVVFSWARFTGKATGSSPSTRLVNAGMIQSVQAQDAQTVVFTLKEPYPFFLARLADPKTFFILPKEVGTGLDPAQKVVGSGPWILREYTPNTVVKFDRHPGWHLGPDRPYYASVTVNIIPEYATQLSQFMAGNLDSATIAGADIRTVKNGVPGVQIYATPAYPLSVLNFSPLETRWDDPRIRHAVSMAMDRDAMLDAAYSLKEVEQAGVPVQRAWHNYIPSAFSDYWLDPRGSEIKPSAAAYFKRDTAAAKELVTAAGGPFETELHYAAPNSGYGEAYRIISELLIQYLRQIGITVRAFEEDYNSVFLLQSSQGKTNGMSWIPQTRVDPFAYYQTQYLNPTHPVYSRWVDPALTRQVQQIQGLNDLTQLKTQIKGLQNELAEKMYIVPMQYGAASTFVAYQPHVQNALTHQTLAQGGPAENLAHYWSTQ